MKIAHAFIIMAYVAAFSVAAVDQAGSATIGGFGSSSLSYDCGKSDGSFGVPEDTRICVCDKSVAGDCRAMADEACRNGFYTCPVGKNSCWCHESPEGPQTPKKSIGKSKVMKGLLSKGSRFQISK